MVRRAFIEAGASRLYVIRNASGHGPDLVGVFELPRIRMIAAVEVKYNRARLSRFQRVGGPSYLQTSLTGVLNPEIVRRFSPRNDRTIVVDIDAGGRISRRALPGQLAAEHWQCLAADQPGHWDQEQIDRFFETDEPGPRSPRPDGMLEFRPARFAFLVARVRPGGQIAWQDWPSDLP